MRRFDFTRESGIVGRDFEALIREFGGKGAGLLLLQEWINDSGSRMEIPPFHLIETSWYGQLEAILQRELRDPIAWVRRNISLKENDELKTRADALYQVWAHPEAVLKVREFERIFSPRVEQALQLMARYAQDDSFHLRASTTIEDFVDDRYYGTFHTDCGDRFYQGQSGRNHFLKAILHFYIQKHLYKKQFHLPVDERLGLVFMPTVGEEGRDHHVIGYSCYPEKPELGVVLEVSQLAFMGRTPRQLLFVRENGLEDDITVHQAQEEVVSGLYTNTYTVAGKKSALSEERVRDITETLRELEADLGYAANLEILARGERILSPVQLRPVPRLDPNRKVRELGPIPRGAKLVANTPFVMGSYHITAPLVRAGYKNNYGGHAFKRPVIMWHSDGAKGHRFYYSDRKCRAMFDPNCGLALTHDSSLVPRFGPERERFAFMGVPGLANFFSEVMEMKMEPVGEGREGRFFYTPFDITIESDGRMGRIYIPVGGEQLALQL